MRHLVTTGSTLVKEHSQIATARQRAIRMAREHGFREEEQGKLALIVSEAASNFLDHARGGEILLTASREGVEVERSWIDMLAIDQGPGIVKLGKALSGGRDGAKGLGEGLGAIQRLSDRFRIFAPPGGGTTISCALMAAMPTSYTLPIVDEGARPPEIRAILGSACRPKRGETDCGDSWAYRTFGSGVGLLLVIDGLGHGQHAQEASLRAVETLADCKQSDVVGLMGELHENLADTRGAAALALRLDPEAEELRVCGLGNVAGTLHIDADRRGLVSLNGTLGQHRADLQEFVYPWPEGALLVVHTDGISSRWDLSEYPGLRLRHPSLVAGVIYRDHADSRDDATVVVIRR